MGKFTFKLEPLLNFKKQLEENLKHEFGRAVKKLEDEKNILYRQESLLEEQFLYIRQNAGSGISAGTLSEYNSYMSYLKQQIKTQKEKVNRERQNVDKYREELAKALKDIKVFEKLKERRFYEYTREQLLEEQKLNDEIISYSLSSSDE